MQTAHIDTQRKISPRAHTTTSSFSEVGTVSKSGCLKTGHSLVRQSAARVGEGTLNFAVSSDTPWLNLSGATPSTSTNENRQAILSFNTASLPVGTTNAAITITDTNASNSPFVVPVLLTVLGPAISVSTTNIAVTAVQGVSPTPTTLEVWNSGYGTLDFFILTNAPWLSAIPTSGTSIGQVQQVRLGFAIAGLDPGLYEDTLILTNITGEAPSAFVRVVLAVLPPRLTRARAGNNIVLSWPASTAGFSLESATHLGFQPFGASYRPDQS